MEANRLLALRLQEEEREKFNVEERAKFLHDTIAAQRRFLVTIDSEIMERKSDIASFAQGIITIWRHLVIYKANGNFRAFNYLMELLHIFDRQDLFHLYDLVMEQYSEITLEGIELILWGDLKYTILELKDGTIIHMLVERRYSLSKDLLQRMLDLGLEVERESTTALDLIRFIKQQIDEK
ncbi:hypothetical protein Tco_0656469 [Tanacetum coccineum]|uniref:Uncharacterized protein n=1 Tax=Tanacetum coccineum TaxID=301880 RepID=A0ABQ4X9I9_9ASTR